MDKSKAGYKTKTLGIWYDAEGRVKRVDVQGMDLNEVIEELIKRTKQNGKKGS